MVKSQWQEGHMGNIGVDKAVAKDPSKRYQTAGEFREALLGAVGR